MNKSQIKINFYFPEAPGKNINKQEFVDSIIGMMHENDSIKCTGFPKEEDLRNSLLYHIGNNRIFGYKGPSLNEIVTLKEKIYSTIKKCHEVLPHPDLPIFVFVYPWSPDQENGDPFHGVTAFATYYTMHLFIDLKKSSNEAISQTIAHEWSHLVFYRSHDESKCTLLDHIVMEGIAEVFRKETVGGKVAPWSIALNEVDSFNKLKSINKSLDLVSMELYRNIFFGNNEFQQWTGYSIGYNIVKNFRKTYPQLSWSDIISKSSKDILKEVVKEKECDRR